MFLIVSLLSSISSPMGAAQSGQSAYGQSPYYDSGLRRVWLKRSLNFKGLNSHARREVPGIVESTNLSRDNLSREIGRTVNLRSKNPQTESPNKGNQ